MNENVPIDIFKTPMWGWVLSSEHYHSLDYIDYIKELAQSEPSAHKSNIGGWQSDDNLHEMGIFREFVPQLNNIANEVLKPFGVSGQVKEMWANVNYKYSFNGHHTHGGILSGVFYLQVPENSGRLIMVNPAVRAHTCPLRRNNFPVDPQRLALIMFPSWLEHYVEPNLNDEPRISISFNIG